MTDPDLLVIGAGAAGIAAARTALSLGRTCLVLEARGRVGGRAVTEGDALGAPFDLGASWFHAAGRNALVPLARAMGVEMLDSDRARQDITFIGPRRATEAELRAYDAAWQGFEAAIAARAAAGGPDIPVAEAAPRGGPWDATVAHWQGPTIAAAELEAMSLRDFAANALEGPHLLPRPGLGEVLRRLATGLPIRLDAPVRRLRWGRGVTAEGPFGTVTARAAVVTLPTPLLLDGSLSFDPPLPPATLEAASGLPLGLLAKIGLRATGPDRFGLPPFAALDRQVRPGEAMLTAIAWPFGHDHVIGFVGGRAAWELEREGPAAMLGFAMDELANRLGGGVRRGLTGVLATAWGADPFSRGAYSHARPGAAGARAALARPLGPLHLAGEACHPSLSGTVGGAWETGAAAARAALAA